MLHYLTRNADIFYPYKLYGTKLSLAKAILKKDFGLFLEH